MTAPPSTNPLALVAFGLTILMFVLFGLYAYVIAPHSLEFEELAKEIQKRGTDPSSQVSALMDYANSAGGRIPSWFIAAGLLQLCGLAACAASLICALIALRHRARRGLAVSSIMATSAVIALVLLNLFGALV